MANESRTATVECLTAEVRVLMVGSRQVTLSVFRQLDNVHLLHINVMGRVTDRGSYDEYWVIGSHTRTGELCRSSWEWYIGCGKDSDRIKEDIFTYAEEADSKMLEYLTQMPYVRYFMDTFLGGYSIEELRHHIIEAHHGRQKLFSCNPSGNRIYTVGSDDFLQIWKKFPLIILAGLK